MVYCGKPSKACESCRTRRIKCDLRRPCCTQCSKIGKTCPGYREQLDLFFRDESAAVAQKMQSRPKRQRASDNNKQQKIERSISPSSQTTSSPEYTTYSESSETASDEGTLTPFNWAPALPIEDIATVYFLGSYIESSHFDYLPKVYNVASPSSPLFAALTANACANMYRETGVPAFYDSAQEQYTRALTQTNAAIASPDQAVLDSTICAVLLLGLFETLTQGQPKCPDSFIAHHNGAAALLKLRGKDQFDTEIGKRIFAQISMNMRVTCADRSVELPSDFMEMDEIGSKHFGEDHFLTRFLHIVDGFNYLRRTADQEIESGNLTTDTIDKALQLDHRLAKILEIMSTTVPFETIQLEQETKGVLGKVYHRYPNHRIAQRWNATRMMRLVFNHHIYSHMERFAQSKSASVGSDSAGFLLQQIAARNVEDMGRQICASVPQFCKPGANGLLPVTPSLFLLWPLAFTGHSKLSSPDVKAYVIDRLKFLGRETRLPQGTWAADMIESNRDMESWLHLSHIA